MAHSNILGGDSLPTQPTGSDTESLGTSDNSDSGSDVVGALSQAELRSDSDSTGTGESTDVERDEAATASDIRPDHLLRGAEGTRDTTALDGAKRSPLLDDAREEIDTLASDDDAATGQDAGNGEDGPND